MKVYLQQLRSLHYYADSRDWVKGRGLAKSFSSAPEAMEFAQLNDIAGARLVLALYNDAMGQFDLFMPCPPRGSPPSADAPSA